MSKDNFLHSLAECIKNGNIKFQPNYDAWGRPKEIKMTILNENKDKKLTETTFKVR